jgi:hypothetical protein
MRCDRCLNARTVVSENGLHSVCCLNDAELTSCLLHKEDHFIENPMKKEPKG